jgi:[acyl-carrier-protein] S-malonyltransferase
MFPGQGSQYAGMRRKLGVLSAGQERLFGRADELLGFPLTRLIDEGPQEELTRTFNAQPALLVTGLAAAMAVEERGLHPDLVMGHSLGEYAALVQAGVLSFEDALSLVRVRGQLMARAVERTPGRMAAVIGADAGKLDALVAELARTGILEITNANAPGQVVLSGENSLIDQLVEGVRARRLGRALPLDVSAPFHSSMMRPLAGEFSRHLDAVRLSAPRCSFIDNVSGMEESDPERIRAKLVEQLFRPVLWEQGIRRAGELGMKTFVECGPRTVLSGLVKRTLRDVSIIGSEALLTTPGETAEPAA